MKKAIALLMAIAMTASVCLMGCSKDSGGTSSTGGGTSGNASDTSSSAPPTSDPVTITIAGESEMITRLMAEKLKEVNPNITVEHYSPGEAGWVSNEVLLKWAAADTLPDIVNLSNPEIVIQNDLLVDIKQYFDNDPNKNEMYADLVQYNVWEEKMLMLPRALFFNGVMVNKDLISANNLPVPSYDWTIDEYMEIAKKLTKPGTQLGSYSSLIWLEFVPQYNDALVSAGFNRSTMKWELGEEWQECVQKMADLVVGNFTADERLRQVGDSDGTWEAWYALSREIIGEDDPWAAWQKGTVATWTEGSYWSKWDENNEIYGGFDWDFYPTPVATKGNVSRPVMIVDNYAITKACKNPDAAFEVLKFFTYSKEGAHARIDIGKNYNPDTIKEKFPDLAAVEGAIPDTLSVGLPACDDQEIRDAWFDYYKPKDGIKEIVNNLPNSKPYIDSSKVLPGWGQTYNEIMEDVVLNQVFTGEKSAADVAADLEQRLNAKHQEIFDAMK